MRAKAAEMRTPVKIIACGGNRFDMQPEARTAGQS